MHIRCFHVGAHYHRHTVCISYAVVLFLFIFMNQTFVSRKGNHLHLVIIFVYKPVDIQQQTIPSPLGGTFRIPHYTLTILDSRGHEVFSKGLKHLLTLPPPGDIGRNNLQLLFDWAIHQGIKGFRELAHMMVVQVLCQEENVITQHPHYPPLPFPLSHLP